MQRIRVTGARTGCRKLCVHTLAHDALKAHARAHEAYGSERQRIAPRRDVTVAREAWLPALPDAECGCHGEERLDEGTKEEPCAGLCAHAVADASYEGTEDEGEHARQRLLVCEVERGVALP